jgi:hypothetical protein
MNNLMNYIPIKKKNFSQFGDIESTISKIIILSSISNIFNISLFNDDKIILSIFKFHILDLKNDWEIFLNDFIVLSDFIDLKKIFFHSIENSFYLEGIFIFNLKRN